MEENKTGKIFVISAPSGGGKTTLCNILKKRMPVLGYSISVTTRTPRKNEIAGTDYIFVTEEEFDRRIKSNDFLEWAVVHGYRYGTSKTYVLETINAGRNITLDIDVQGAMQIKEIFPKDSRLIFITVSSLEILRERLKKRHSDDEREIARRMKIAEKEMKYIDKYDYCILNDDLDKVAEKLVEVIRQEIKMKNI
jgi:guanylate kinase